VRREILIDSDTGETRVALLEDDLLTELFIERPRSRGVTGNIYKGRVSNVLPGMQSAFVDIGLERDAFLYVEEVGPANEEFEGLLGGEGEEEGVPRSVPVPPPRASIEDLLRPGQEIVVQVAKEPVAQKGARITAHLSLPGRFLVYLPGLAGHVAVSRKIGDPDERARLKASVEAVVRDPGIEGGFIVRTAGEGLDAGEFHQDARYLAGLWEEIRRSAAARPAPALLHQEAGAVVKVLRDVLGHDVQQVVADTDEAYREALESVRRMQPALAPRVHLHAGASSLFEERGVQQQLERALRSRVWLKSGGYIVINQTEALVAIDVNTGKYVGKRRLEETILTTNLEAAREIVRQVRLRDLGGIIVIDFIDMEEEASRRELIRALEAELRRDRSKSRMQPLSEFGLVEITRQRTKRSLERMLCRPCPACNGSGRVKSAETVCFEVLREARRLRPACGGGALRARVHPEVAQILEAERETLAAAAGLHSAAAVTIEGDPALHYEQFSLLPAPS
jgi:ribonuclease G